MKCFSRFGGEDTRTMAQIQPVTTYEHLLYTTVRLELALVGNQTGVGTGFVYDHYTSGGTKVPLLVSNKHVVKDSLAVKVRFHQRDPSAPKWAVSGYVDLDFPLPESAWTGHPDPDIDLSAIKFNTFQQQAQIQGKEIAVFSLSQRFIPDDLAVFDAVEDIVMIGYPSGWWDSTNNYPIVRRGITASHPGIDFNGKPEIAIDMACFHGSSGSPVLLPYDMGRPKPISFFDDTRLFAFLGVLATAPMHLVEGQVLIPSPAPIPTQSTIPMNLGFIIKAKEVAALASVLAGTTP
jgi:hypothetical protein